MRSPAGFREIGEARFAFPEVLVQPRPTKGILAAITVMNPSKVHALLPQSSISLTSANWSQTLSPATLSERIGIGLVQPGHRRTFVLPVDVPPLANRIQARLDFKPAR